MLVPSETSEGIETLGVAEAKARFSELIERVLSGETIVVERRGKAVIKLVPPETAVTASKPKGAAIGLLAIAGALEEWEDFDGVMREVVASRRTAKDRPAPSFD